MLPACEKFSIYAISEGARTLAARAPPPELGEDRGDFRYATIFDAAPPALGEKRSTVARRKITSAARLSARAIALGRTPRSRADLEPHPLIIDPATP